jgi:UDP-N-acetyl-2-amino-2-deoxyglucuronate dehydrogenase
MSNRVRLAYVGCGAISPMHTFGIEQSEARIDVVACIDPNESAARVAAEPFGAEVYASLAEGIAAGAFDAVDIMVPHGLTESVSAEAFDAGLHVLLEKPMATTLDACDRIMANAAAADGVFMVAENSQYWPDAVAAQRAISDGRIGDLVTARATFFIPPLADFYGGDAPWRFDDAAATHGIAVDTGSHWIRPLRMWLGEVAEVVGHTARPFSAMAGESLVLALLRFESGVVATLDGLLTAASLGPQPLFRVTGSAGEITVEASGAVTVYDDAHRRGEVIAETGGYLNSYAGEFADFAAVVLDGAAPVAGPEQAIEDLKVAFALYRSAESKTWEQP